MNLTIYCDGGSRGNPGQAASAFIAYEERGDSAVNMRKIAEKGVCLGVATNNIAEYRAVLESLNWLLEFGKNNKVENVTYLLDSNLVVSQINGQFKVKEPNIQIVFNEVKGKLVELKKVGTNFDFKYTPRANNSEADGLVNKTLDSKI